jgi:hypothetical protein
MRLAHVAAGMAAIRFKSTFNVGFNWLDFSGGPMMVRMLIGQDADSCSPYDFVA